MSLFLGFIEYSGIDIEQRKEKTIEYITEYFKPQSGDEFYLMDPYLDVVNSIQEPIENNQLDEMFWSSLIATLETDNTKIKIITSTNIDNLRKISTDPPFAISYENDNVEILVSKYVEKKIYEKYSLHDRYIIRKNGAKIKGIHIGPSMDDIHNKDISITCYNKKTAKLVYKNFMFIWNECKKTKGWKK